MGLSLLVEMGYQAEEVSIAIDRCGRDTPIAELSDFICAARMAKEADFPLIDKPYEKIEFSSQEKVKRKDKRKILREEAWNVKRTNGIEKEQVHEDYEECRLPNPMIGFGVPNGTLCQVRGTLPEAAVGPPYFYFENVASPTKGVWSTISIFLFDIAPEFVDSKHFCADVTSPWVELAPKS